MPDNEPPNVSEERTDSRGAATAFVTTEHFTLQGARSSTISESTGRASMFLGSVSGGLVALGLVAAATRVETAFYALGLVILPTLSFVGLVTFDRVLQSGIEDLGYARRIALLRAYYFDNAPELDRYLLSVAPVERLSVLGLRGGLWQSFVTVAGMVGLITSVLAGSTAGLVAVAAFDHPLAVALAAGGSVAIAALFALMRYEHAAWRRALLRPFTADDEGRPK